MAHFIVDSASLDRVREHLGVLHGQLLSVPAIVGGSNATMLGGPGLEAELDGFTREWQHAVAAVAGRIDLMQMRLSAAAAAYRQLERHQRERARHASHGPRAGTGSGTTVIDGGTGIGSGTTVIDPGRGTSTSTSSSSGHGSGSGTTVIGGGSGPQQGSGTTVIAGTRQPGPAPGR